MTKFQLDDAVAELLRNGFEVDEEDPDGVIWYSSGNYMVCFDEEEIEGRLRAYNEGCRICLEHVSDDPSVLLFSVEDASMWLLDDVDEVMYIINMNYEPDGEVERDV